MAFQTTILVNQTVSDITLIDLGSIVVPGSGQLDVTNLLSQAEVQGSRDLNEAIANDEILINNGEEDLSKEESFSFATGGRKKITRVVTVGLGGDVEYTSIQDAIDSITVSAGEQYVIRISAGEYTENVTMKNGVSLVGMAVAGSVIISNTSGTVLTTGSGGGFPVSEFRNIKFQLTATSTTSPRLASIQGGRNTFINCTFSVDVTDGFVNAIDMTGGVNSFNQCGYLYNHTGTSGGDMIFLNVTGTASTFNIEGGYCSIDTDGTDTLDYVVFIRDAATSTPLNLIRSLQAEMRCSGNFDGHAGFIKLTAGTTDNICIASHIDIECTGTAQSNSIAYAYDVDSSGNSAILRSTGNQIFVSGFEVNYSVEVDVTDTVTSHFDDITAADGKAKTGTFDFVTSPSDGNVQASGSYLEMYDNTVTVAKRGGDYTTIQGAIDAITDASISKTYVILVYPGTYAENVDFTGKPYIDIRGVGTRSDTVIAASSGVTMTVDGGSPFECLGMTLENTASTGGKVLLIPSGLSPFSGKIVFTDCAMVSTVSNGYGSVIEQNSGRLITIGGRLQYFHSGTGGGTHKIIDIVDGDSAFVSKGQLQTMSIGAGAQADDVVLIDEANISSETSLFTTTVTIERSGTVSGDTIYYRANGTSTNKALLTNDIRITNGSSGGTAYIYKTEGNGCEVSSIGNRLQVNNFTNNYIYSVATNDTIFTDFDVTDSTDYDAESGGDLIGISSRGDGDLYISRDVFIARNVTVAGGSNFTLGATINEFSTDGTMVANSDTKVPTEKAIVTYVGQLANEYVKQDGTTPFTAAQPGISPTLGSHLTTKTYVDAAVAGGGTSDLGPFITRTLSTPPLSPSDGDKYIIAEGGGFSSSSSSSEDSESSSSSESSGNESSSSSSEIDDSWDGRADQVAEWSASGGIWTFTIPIAGNNGWVNDEAKTYLFDGTEWIAQGQNISHTALQDIGTNTHPQIDSHIASTANPHAVTNTQVGLSNVTNDSQLKRSAGDFATFDPKASIANEDLVLIEDSADSNIKKRVQAANLPDQKVKVSVTDTTQDYLGNKIVGTANKITVTPIGGGGDEDLQIGYGSELTTLTDGSNSDALHVHAHSATTGQTTDDHHNQSHAFGGADHTASTKANVDNKISDASLISTLGGEIAAVTEKTALVPADIVLIEDSEATNAKKKATIANVVLGAGGISGGVYQESAALSSTTNTAFQTKLSLSISEVTGVTYRIAWTMEFNAGNANKAVEVRMYDVTDAQENGLNYQQTNATGNYFSFAGIHYHTATATGTHTWSLQYRQVTATCNVRNAVIESFQVG